MNDAIRSLLGVIKESGTDSVGSNYSTLIEQLHRSLGSADPSESAVEPCQPAEAEEPESKEEPPAPAADPSVHRATGVAGAQSATESSIRLRVDQLDALMNLAGELVLVRNEVVQYSTQLDDPASHAAAQRLNRITTEMQEGIMKIRMQPIGTLWSKLPRVVRGMSMQLAKEVELRMVGSDTEVDKTLLEAIKDPLTHLVRNSLDHGIEGPEQREAADKPRMAVLTLTAFHESGQVNIIVKDDGRGIDPNVIRAKAVDKGLLTELEAERLDDRAALGLLFMPGFSTAEKVTSISGRGVGMDVVKRNLERVGGTVEIESEVGQGTEVIVRIPLTLAIIPALTVHSGGNRYVIPQANLVELLRIDAEDECGIEEVMGQQVFRLRGDLLSLVDLNALLGTPSSRGEGDDYSIVVVQASGRIFGLFVDGIHESEEIVVKPLESVVKSLKVYAGTTILADGQVALILDIAGIADKARLAAEGEPLIAGSRAYAPNFGEDVQGAPVEYLIVSAGDDRRVAMDLSQIDRLEDIDPAIVERAGALQFIQYRDELLRLVDLGRALGRESSVDPSKKIWKAVVRTHGGFSYGLLVDDVLDIVEADSCEARHESNDSVISAVLVVGGQVTELLDDDWLTNAIGLPSGATEPAPRQRRRCAELEVAADSSERDVIQLCSLRHGNVLYGIDVLDVQEVLMPQVRTPIPLSPPEVEGLLNLRGDTVLSFDLGAVLTAAGETEFPQDAPEQQARAGPAKCHRMNVVVRTPHGAVSMLVDEVGEVMTFMESDFAQCPAALTAAQRAVARGVFKLDNELLIQLDVDALYGLAENKQLAAHP